MSIFTKKLMDWNLLDCIKITAGTLGVLWAADKLYDSYQERQKVNNTYDSFNGDDVYVQEETSE